MYATRILPTVSFSYGECQKSTKDTERIDEVFVVEIIRLVEEAI